MDRLPPIAAAEVFASRQVRLAKTARDPVTDAYPAQADHANVYWIIFLDASYPDTVGYQAVTTVDRSAKAKAKACNILSGAAADQHIPEGSLLWVCFHNARWWIMELACPPVA